MKTLLALSILLPTIASAKFELPTPQVGETICYTRSYTVKEIEKNELLKKVDLRLSRLKDLPDSLNYLIKVLDKKNRQWANGGGVYGASNGKASLGGDCDTAKMVLVQDQTNPNKVRLEVDYLNLFRINGGDDGCSEISLPEKDKTMVLFRDTLNCEQ